MSRPPPKIKPHTDALRARLEKMEVPGTLVLGEDDFKPTTAWFSKENQQSGRYFSCRHYDGKMYVFRLK